MERAIAQLARPRLEVRRAVQAIAEIGANERNARARGGCGRTLFVAVAVRPTQVVIDMPNDKVDRQPATQGRQNGEQADGVGAA